MGGIVYTVKDISVIAQSIASVSVTLQVMEPERRDKVASYLEEIGSTLARISVALGEGKPLDELDGAMQIHTSMFAQTVAGVIDADLIKKLQSLLGNSSIGDHLKLMLDQPVPQQYEENDFPEHDHSMPFEEQMLKYGAEQMVEYRLRKLNEVSGMFKALASSIRAGA